MEYIALNPKTMAGKPIIEENRISVEHIIAMLAQSISIDEILIEYNGLKKKRF